MHQSILALPIPPPGNPRAFALFFSLSWQFPGVGPEKRGNAPPPGKKKDDKCPAPGHTDSFIECILDFHYIISFLV